MNNYTKDDFLVWKTLFNRQMNILHKKACPQYLEALDKMNFNEFEIPEIEKINRVLLTQTGWQVTVVPNIVAEKDFFTLLSQKKFPVTVWLRKPHQLNYIEEPDMFHDIFGHVPLLCNKAYTGFFKQVADIAAKYADNNEIITQLGRLYWFTIEFGLMKKNNHTTVYGAGIISSPGEIKHALGNEVEILPYEVYPILNTPFNNSVIQNRYFFIESFEQLYESVGLIKQHIESVNTLI
jgi:phenylalanine-4-hydroxylase